MTEFDPKRGISVATLAYEYPSKFDVAEHAHRSDQLIYAISGLMEVSSEQSVWLIPPHFALWIPARTCHRIHMPGPVSMRTLYLRTALKARLDLGCAVLHVTPLLRELIVETVRVGQLRMRNHYECALRDLLISQLQKSSPMPTFVTLPRERRALAVAQAFLQNPAESKPMAALCAEAGVSVRTIERAFRREIGSSFEIWRRQVRLTKAVELLVSGYSIKEVAHQVGYCQSSAFVEMFRRTLGTTPKAWISALRKHRPIIHGAPVSFPRAPALREGLKVTRVSNEPLERMTVNREVERRVHRQPRSSPTGSESPDHRLRSPAASAQEEK